MISYELAKQLKDSGFPLKKPMCLCGDEICIHRAEPTLSELIEACGNKFIVLWNHSGKEYQAVGGEWSSDTQFDGRLRTKCYSTPEEAIAELYLLIHNK